MMSNLSGVRAQSICFHSLTISLDLVAVQQASSSSSLAGMPSFGLLECASNSMGCKCLAPSAHFWHLEKIIHMFLKTQV
eukprot:6478298-Amphidinium_carterae.4